MASSKAPTSRTAANLGFESQLWAAADALRGSMDAAEYKHVVLGLIFLKYISDAFEEKHGQLEAERDQGADPEDPDEYRAENIFWVPAEARWEKMKAQAKQPQIGQLVDDAMAAIERDNPSLKGVLPKDYARPALNKERLGQLIDLITNIRVGDEESRSRDVLGRVYEYFLSQFASAEGKKGGEFYTPRCVVRVLVEMIEPYEGRIYDPCCGSSGMFVQSEEFIEAHGGRIGDLSIYGQELNYTTWRLAQMNLAIRGIDGHIAQGDTFHNDRFPDLKADYILANPPFNVSDWGGDRLRDDKRWQYGAPPTGNANFAWVQHMVHHLAPKGVAGFILANNALTSETGGEDLVRQRLIDANLIDCIVTLPERLFYSTPIPASVWVIRRGREVSRSPRDGEVLFIDASRLGVQISRTHRELSEQDIGRISSTYRSWRHSRADYADVTGFCRSVSIQAVADNGNSLLPAAYVHPGHVQATRGIRLKDVLDRGPGPAVVDALGHAAMRSKEFEVAYAHVSHYLRELEANTTFETLCLDDLLEKSDERLGDDEEPEILTCTESAGLVLQRERFAKRVATDDVRKYKVVRMGDVVYNPYLLWKGSIDQCWIVELGITSPAYEVLHVRPGFDRTLVGQLVTSREMIKRYDGISFGTVQRRRRAPVERFLELKVNFPIVPSEADLGALLSVAQSCQFASRNAERAVRDFISTVASRLR
jgi:type I restriction enzyme M protein